MTLPILLIVTAIFVTSPAPAAANAQDDRRPARTSHRRDADPADFDAALADVIRAAVATVEPTIVGIETIGGAQPLISEGPNPAGGAAGPGGRRRAQRGPRLESFRLGDGPTTGLIISPDGLILTSSFNFARKPTVITVVMPDGSRHVARLLGVDFIRRLAVLRVNASGLPTREWAPVDQMQIGQYVVACGRGLGGPDASISLGIVSALNRRNGNCVQTDAKISPVNYGGPLIDIEGRVVGLIVPMAGAGGSLAGVEWYDGGIGFAVPRVRIDAVMDRLIAGESIEPGKIGVELEEDESGALPFLDELFKWSQGVKIKAVAPNSPASRAGLESGERILALDGQPTADLLELQRRLSDRAAGEDVTLTIKPSWKKKFDIRIRLARASEIGEIVEDGAETEVEPPKPGDQTLAPTSQPDPD